MFKRYILVSALFTYTANAFAYKPVDSIGVENNNGKKLIIHKVDLKESYYSISRRYNVNVKDIQNFNNNVSLQVGAVIKVPTDLPFTTNTNISAPTITNTGFFEYTVTAKDNLNLIAERYATTVAEIKRINHLSTNNLQIGQVLKVPFVKSGSVVKAINNQATQNHTPVVSSTNSTQHIVQPKEYLGVIAKQYGITVDELKAANNLSNNNLKIGQVLIIPSNTNVVNASNAPIVNQNTTVAQPNEQTFEHVIVPGETIYSIASKYKITTFQLKNLNNLTSNDLVVGKKLKISGEKPVDDKTVANTPVTSQNKVIVEPKPVAKVENKVETPIASSINKNESVFEHTVAQGETIYAIASKYKLTTYQLKTLNNLTANDLVVGQKLKIKGEKPSSTTEREENPTNAIDSTSLKSPSLRRPAAVYGLNRVEEKGTAVWITDPDLDPSKMLILHRTAPVGTVIQITNPMTNRSTFAKVVGKFTENETTKDVIIVMTKAVADAVGALDKRFFCNLSYGPKDNEK